MRWIAYSLALLLLASGSLVASSTAASATPSGPQETQQSEPEEEDFVPTEKVPADSAISFPVDI